MGLPPAVISAGRGVPRDLEQTYRALAEGVAGHTLTARLDVLPRTGARMLDAMAVAGTQTSVGLLSELSQQSDPRPPLQELARRGFVHLSPGSCASCPRRRSAT